ncbi:hypothetical protein S40288_06415 [Stachybotrys chartarum IBT 40288]|nr:hypothetical protein S40288_06415 [Stachybotrys chartarum IBT 40288]
MDAPNDDCLEPRKQTQRLYIMAASDMSSNSYSLAPIAESWGTRFFTSQFTKIILPARDICLAGQTVVLTGGNQGLGLACAEWLCELHVSRLIMAVRTPSKGEAVAAELRARFPKVTIETWQVDMLSYDSIQAFVGKCQSLERLDIAILNAGATEQTFKLSPEAHEATFQVNYLSTVLLATLLLPLLKAKSPAGKPGRLTIVNSGTAYAASLPHIHTKLLIPTFDDPALFEPSERYWASKAIAHFWILKLVERVKSEDVIVNLVDPGLTKSTSLSRDYSVIGSLMFWILTTLLGRTTRVGASTYVDAAVVKGEESHGCFIMDGKIFPYATSVYGEDGRKVADQLWEETMAELRFAKANEILDSM